MGENEGKVGHNIQRHAAEEKLHFTDKKHCVTTGYVSWNGSSEGKKAIPVFQTLWLP